MQVRSGFYRRNRRGQVMKIIRERYIQSDHTVGYGFIAGHRVTLSELREMVTCAAHKQLVVVDTNVCLHQIDVLEHKSPVTAIVVILQTVLQEIRHLNISVYRRLVALLQDESRAFIFFPNEVCEQTFAVRTQQEKVNDFNDRKIRVAAMYYQQALEGNVVVRKSKRAGGDSDNDVEEDEEEDNEMNIQSHGDDDDSDNADMAVAGERMNEPIGEVVLLSNDKANCKLAREQGLRTVMSMNAFVSKYVNQYPELNDLLSFDADIGSASSDKEGPKTMLYTPHLSDVEVSVGVRSKIYLKGVLRVRRDDCNDCYVIVHEDSSSSSSSSSSTSSSANAAQTGGKDNRRSILIVGLENVNRAIDGDLVAVQLVAAPTAVAVSQPATSSPEPAGVMADSAEASAEAMDSIDVNTEATKGATSTAALKPGVEYGRVVGIVRRQLKQYAGSLSRSAFSACLSHCSCKIVNTRIYVHIYVLQ
jgi:exosome complex exonuclease DIS3/RRP44